VKVKRASLSFFRFFFPKRKREPWVDVFCRFIVLVGKKNGAKVVMVKVDPHDAILTEIHNCKATTKSLRNSYLSRFKGKSVSSPSSMFRFS
jgi:hypothetical protein